MQYTYIYTRIFKKIHREHHCVPLSADLPLFRSTLRPWKNPGLGAQVKKQSNIQMLNKKSILVITCHY